jgi:hypothetical protein
MARIAEEEIERLKHEVSVERLAEARGIELKRHGADLIGLCPFHEDRSPSLVISPKKKPVTKESELIERSFVHCYDTGRMRRTYLRRHKNILKRSLIHVGAFNLSFIFRSLLGAGTPREPRYRLTRLFSRLFCAVCQLWMQTERGHRVFFPLLGFRSQRNRRYFAIDSAIRKSLLPPRTVRLRVTLE